jgi:hypothetical protein
MVVKRDLLKDDIAFSEISGSQGEEYEDGCLLECCAV